MGGTLTWPVDENLRAVTSQAVATKKPVKFVKDQGVYLLAFGKKAPKDNKIAYAKGFDPEKVNFDDWYDKAHRICGGDDFAEDIPTEFLERIIARGCKTFSIKLTARSMNMEAQ